MAVKDTDTTLYTSMESKQAPLRDAARSGFLILSVPGYVGHRHILNPWTPPAEQFYQPLSVSSQGLHTINFGAYFLQLDISILNSLLEPEIAPMNVLRLTMSTSSQHGFRS